MVEYLNKILNLFLSTFPVAKVDKAHNNTEVI